MKHDRTSREQQLSPCQICSSERNFNELKQITHRLGLLDRMLRMKNQESNRSDSKNYQTLKRLQKKLRRFEGDLISEEFESQKLTSMANNLFQTQSHPYSNLTLGNKNLPHFQSATTINQCIEQVSSPRMSKVKVSTVSPSPEQSINSLTGRFCELILQLGNKEKITQKQTQKEIIRVAGKIKNKKQKAINQYGF